MQTFLPNPLRMPSPVEVLFSRLPFMKYKEPGSIRAKELYKVIRIIFRRIPLLDAK